MHLSFVLSIQHFPASSKRFLSVLETATQTWYTYNSLHKTKVVSYMKQVSVLLASLLFLLSGCTLFSPDTAPAPTTTTTTAFRSVVETVPFYDWTQTEMITYLTEKKIITNTALLTVTREEDLADTGISGHFTYQTPDGAACLDVFFWDPQSSDESVAQMQADMKAGRPLTLHGLTLTGDRRIGNFLFLYGTSADPAFVTAVVAACDALPSE